MTPSAVHLEPEGELSLVYASGNENAPGDPFGECVLTLHPDGRARLDNRHAGTSRAFEGKVERATFARIAERLNAAGFPVVPPHRIPPGATRTLRVRQAGQEHHIHPMGWHAAPKLPGYREAFHILDSIVVELSGGKIPLVRNGETGLVSDVEAVT